MHDLEKLILSAPNLYRVRNLVERFFNKIKHRRRVVTRYDKLAANYLAFVQLASIRCALADTILLKRLFIWPRRPAAAHPLELLARRQGRSPVLLSSRVPAMMPRLVRDGIVRRDHCAVRQTQFIDQCLLRRAIFPPILSVLDAVQQFDT
jgi:hypothetical protein